MLIDYIGQELIWNLTATHPYNKNRRNYCMMLRCKSLEENREIEGFFADHLENVSFEYEKWGNALILKRIRTPDVLDGVGEVTVLNEFK